MTAFYPAGSMILVEIANSPEAVEHGASFGVILAIGPGEENHKGKLRATGCSVGQTVAFPVCTGYRVALGGNHTRIIHASNVLGLLARTDEPE